MGGHGHTKVPSLGPKSTNLKRSQFSTGLKEYAVERLSEPAASLNGVAEKLQLNAI